MKRTITIEIEVDAEVVANNLLRHGFVKPGERMDYLRTNNYIKGYLNGAATTQLEITKELDAFESDVHSVLVDKLGNLPEPEMTDKFPFWHSWNIAQGNKNNRAPFDLTDGTISLLNRADDSKFVAILGVTGKVNRNNDMFVISEVDLKKGMDNLVGKNIGEITAPRLTGLSGEDAIKRLCLIEQKDTAGTLVDYAINTSVGVDGPVHEIVGLIEPSQQLKDWVANRNSAHFGIRSLAYMNKPTEPESIKVKDIMKLVGFDIHIENPRCD